MGVRVCVHVRVWFGGLICFAAQSLLRMDQIWEEGKELDCESGLDLSRPGNLLRPRRYSVM